MKTVYLAIFFSVLFVEVQAQHSVARKWNEVILEGIRNDYARPTVHARNLFHLSAAMYDSWAVFEQNADTYFLGKEHQGFYIEFNGINQPNSIDQAREIMMSYAAYRIIYHRFKNSPGSEQTLILADQLMQELGFDINMTSIDYSNGDPAALGNYLASKIIEFGLQDGSNESDGYSNTTYKPINPPLVVQEPGSQGIIDPNRWQPLEFNSFIDQSGNVIPGNVPNFLSPEWGDVVPFCLTENDLSADAIKKGYEHNVYLDPGPPSFINIEDDSVSKNYKWGFSLVSIWSSHLDVEDSTTMDISPASIGNLDIANFPKSHSELENFYDQTNGGDPSIGYDINPKTNAPYEKQEVLRADYARVLAEFWADGPNSETPPGHWFTILNYVSDNPATSKKYRGEGEILNDLEWDVKGYFALSGAMHDAAICAWSVKGYYDYIRPVSALRYMADQGQSSNPELPNFSESGIPLVKGYIEIVEDGDPLAQDAENIGKIKLYAWKGHDYILNPLTDVAGVGWILAENWLPYQRSSFVTPPFAGYVSGHSTFSRAAAYILTALTGDEYFPGGLGEFHAPKNDFLVFEAGPTTDVTLQWAKYYDASDQCSLSRIWGGIHPPMDDINGRIMGQKLGEMAFSMADKYFTNTVLSVDEIAAHEIKIYPNPVIAGHELTIDLPFDFNNTSIELIDFQGGIILKEQMVNKPAISLPNNLNTGLYILNIISDGDVSTQKIYVHKY